MLRGVLQCSLSGYLKLVVLLNMSLSLPHRSAILVLVTVSVWGLALSLFADPLAVLDGYWHFAPLGVVGAVAANSTGAGGGIVFIPAFSAAGLDSATALGTSIAIQCFGMTAGSLSWLYAMQRPDHRQAQGLLRRLLPLSGMAAVLGILSGQYLLPDQPFPVTTVFKYFSILFGVLLMVVSLRRNPHRHTRYSLRRRDAAMVAVVCYAGGVVTSWISIGAGEWVALLLFFLGYPTLAAVCVAVCISSWSVLAGVAQHIDAGTISYEILLFAAPAAILGGSVARFLSERLGPMRLKIFFAAWIIATGFAMS